MLVDGDPLGGGLDVLLGGEQAEGRRWPDFAASKGRVVSGALEESLPRLHDLRVLSWDRGDSVVIRPEAMRSVLAAARRGGGVVVVDLPRRVDEAVAEALAQLDVGLLVVPGELRAVAAAARVASMVGMVLQTCGPWSEGRTPRVSTSGGSPTRCGCRSRANCPWNRACRRRRTTDPRPGRGRADPGRLLYGLLGAGTCRGRERDVMTVERVAAGGGPADGGLLDAVRQRLAESGADPTPARVAAALRAQGRLLGDAEVLGVAEELRCELVGTGPLEPLLADPSVTDVLVCAPDRVWVDRGGGLELTAVTFADTAAVRFYWRSGWRPWRVVGWTTPGRGSMPGCRTAPGCTRCCRPSRSARRTCRCGWCGPRRSRWPNSPRRGRCRRAGSGCCGR